jgi:hypothetical protein
MDTVLNGTETDLDCGGSCAPGQRCVNGQMCGVAGDCQSASCVSNRCAAAGCQTCWKVQYQNRPTNDSKWAGMGLRIVSTGATSSVPLSEFKLRYWFTADAGHPLVTPISCNTYPRNCANITTSFVPVSPARTNANTYMEVGFTAGAGNLSTGGADSGEVQLAFHYSDWAAFNFANDYSCDPSNLTMLVDWTKVTLYHQGNKVWGTEPP